MSVGFNKALVVDVVASSAKRGELDSTEFMYGGGGPSRGYSQPTRVMAQSLDFPTMESMYTVNVWIRAIVDKIVKRSVAVQPIIKAILRKPVDKPTNKQSKRIESIQNLLSVPNNMNQSFDHIRRQTFTDVLIWDAAALELVGNAKGVSEMYAVSGDSVRLNVDKRGIFKSQTRAYIQRDSSTQQPVATFAADEMCYFMQYPRAKKVYGLSPLESLRQTVTAELYAADFNIKRFVNDATPRFAILFDNLGIGQGGAAMERLRKWWDTELRGKPHRPILIGTESGSMKFEKVGLSNEDMQFQEYSRWLLSKIMSVYHMQAAVLGVIEVNQGRVNSSYQEEQFKKDALRPLLKTFSNQFNTMALWSAFNFGYNDIYLDWEGLDDIDKEREAKIHETYLRQGVFTINMVLRELGMDPVPWGDVPYIFNQMVPMTSWTSEPKPALPAKIEAGTGDGNGNFSVNKWLAMGIAKGGLIPTGLERVEPSDENEAIAKILSLREHLRSTKVLAA